MATEGRRQHYGITRHVSGQSRLMFLSICPLDNFPAILAVIAKQYGQETLLPQRGRAMLHVCQ